MTELKITQADRDAAEDAQTFTTMRGEELAYEFARHRIAAEEGKAELVEAVQAARDALHFHYVEWDGEPEDAVPLQLARSKCDAALARVQGEG